MTSTLAALGATHADPFGGQPRSASSLAGSAASRGTFAAQGSVSTLSLSSPPARRAAFIATGDGVARARVGSAVFHDSRAVTQVGVAAPPVGFAAT